MENIQYNNKVHLIIERTLNGLDYDFVSPGLNKNEFEKLEFSFDETKQVGQFNSGYCYSLKRTAKHLIYSIINTDYKDNAQRMGFCAIRLIVDHTNIVQNVHSHLTKIVTLYVEYLQESTLNNQNYDRALEDIANDTIPKPWVNPRVNYNDIVSYSYLDVNKDLSEVFNNPKLIYANKVYFFANELSSTESVARQFSLQPLNNILDTLRETKFINPERWGYSIHVNDQAIPVSSEEVLLVCKSSDRVSYKVVSDRLLQNVSPQETDVRIKKEEVKPKEYSRGYDSGANSDGGSSSVWPWIVGILLGLIGGYFVKPYVDDLVFSEPSPKQEELASSKVDESGVFNLSIDTTQKNILYIKSDHPLIKDYRFVYDSQTKGWKYIKRNENSSTAQKLSVIELKLLLGADSLNTNDFTEELRKIFPVAIPEGKKEESKGSAPKSESPPISTAKGAQAPVPAQQTASSTKESNSVKKSQSSPKEKDKDGKNIADEVTNKTK